jgi:hypothetical protein
LQLFPAQDRPDLDTMAGARPPATVRGHLAFAPGTPFCPTQPIQLSTRSTLHHLMPSGLLRSNQKLQQFSDCLLSTDGFAHGSVNLYVVSVATALFLLCHIATRDQVVDDGESAPLGNVERRCDVPQPHPRVVGDAGEHSRVIGEEAPLGHAVILAHIFMKQIACYQ